MSGEAMRVGTHSAGPGRAASLDRPEPPKRTLAWPDVVAATQRTETRFYTLNLYRDRGFSADSFGSHSRGGRDGGTRLARETMADVVTRTEDCIEVAHPRWSEDPTLLRDLRRRLERELWP